MSTDRWRHRCNGTHRPRVLRSILNSLVVWVNEIGAVRDLIVKRKRYRWALDVGIVSCIVLVAASYGGSFAAPLDSLAVVRVYVCAIGLMLTILNACVLTCVAGVIFFIVAIFESVIPYYRGAGAIALTPLQRESVSIYQKNVGLHRSDQRALAEDIRRVNADFVTLQELPAGKQTPVIGWLKNDYPVQLVCKGSTGRSLAILSQHRYISKTAVCATALAKARFKVGDQVIDIVSVHLTKPWPFPQKKQLEYLGPILGSLANPSIIGGDFNATPMMSVLDEVATLTGTTKARPSYVTLKAFGFPLAVDHIFSTNPAFLWRRPRFGSDHYGIVAQTF